MGNSKTLILFSTLVVLFLLICSTSATPHPRAHGGKHVRKFHHHHVWHKIKKPSINHVNSRGHRKHLVLLSHVNHQEIGKSAI
ncbi:hypothetical protein BVRB_5g107860 [Beta vulgaris subsp. vulgaris]|nr:hypothetical protein BVRB_5g107860 [Beta vulgaris subsp. vulgaris]